MTLAIKRMHNLPPHLSYNNNNNNNQYIYKQRQSHAMSQRRWLATAVFFRPSDMFFRFRRNVNSDSSGDRRDAGRRFQSAGP